MLKVVAKFLVAGCLITYLVKSGKLDFTLFLTSLENIQIWLVALFLFILAIGITAFRWQTILHIKSNENLPFKKIFNFTWIGLLFNSVLPGAVSGDIIKILYVKPMLPHTSKKFLLGSVFLDRVLGLMGLMFLMGVVSLFNYPMLTKMSSQVQQLVQINLILSFFVIGILAFMLIPSNFQKKIFKKFNLMEFQGKNFRNKVFISIAISLVSQICIISTFWILTKPFISSNHLPLWSFFTFVPLGFIALAVPIAPAGLGVGHAIFDTLFNFYGVSNGASLFNLYFIGQIFVSLLGVIPYLLVGKINKGEKAPYSFADAK
jgi:hypothetical protein